MADNKYRFLMEIQWRPNAIDRFEALEFGEGDKFDAHRIRNPNISTIWFTELKPALQSGAMVFSKKSDKVSVNLLHAQQTKKVIPQISLSVVHHHVRTSNIYRGEVLEDQWLIHDQGWFMEVTVTDLTSRLPTSNGEIDVVTVQAIKTGHKSWGGAGEPVGVNGVIAGA
ncbi:MAG: hypothetical protein U0167_13480 [bacterium]